MLVRILVLLAGAAIVAISLASAIRALVLPRGSPDRLGRIVFLTMRQIFGLITLRARTYHDRDRVMALYAPVSLLVLLVVWLILVLFGYMAMYWSLGVRPWQSAFKLSGSSLLTLGFAGVEALSATALAFSEAAIGLILVALLIAYLPIMYTAFSRREAAVTMLEVRAGAPPSAVEMVARYNRLGRLNKLNEVWVQWEIWFVEVEESHTSLAALTFFRSPQPDHSWVTAAGAVLDTASLVLAAVDIPHDVQADLCIRAGYLALRRIADFFRIQYDPAPKLGDPISVTREEWDAAYDELVRAGVPLKPDREQAWRAWAGWRVNYDTVLVSLAALTMAPLAPWSSDRSFLLPRKNAGRRQRFWHAAGQTVARLRPR